MEVPLSPLEFMRRARTLYGSREGVVNGQHRWTYEAFFDRCDRWSSALDRSRGAYRSNAAYPASVTPVVLDRYPKVEGDAEQSIRLAGATLRQLFVVDLGHEQPTILLTNDPHSSHAKLLTRYAQRMLIENALSDAVRFFHMDALSSAVGMKVDLIPKQAPQDVNPKHRQHDSDGKFEHRG
jgi:hypothetical protein